MTKAASCGPFSPLRAASFQAPSIGGARKGNESTKGWLMINSRMTRWNPEPERVSDNFLVFGLIKSRVTVDAATADWLEVLVFAFLYGSVGAARAVWQRSGPVGRPDERLHTKPIEVQTMISSQKVQHWMLRSENEILRDISCLPSSNALSNQQQENT